MNPLLNKFETPFETVPFDQIKDEHFLPGLIESIAVGKEEINEIVTNKERATFANVCEAMERSGSLVGRVSSIFFNLHSADTNDERQKIAKDFSSKLTDYSNDILLNKELFNKIKKVHDDKTHLNLSGEEMQLLEKQYKQFVRNGALLDDRDKEKLRKIDQDLSQLSLQFGDNVLKETNDYKLVIESENDLAGLPEAQKNQAFEKAQELDLAGKWVITLDYPSYIPFMTYANNRKLREELFIAFGSKANKNNEFDNKDNVKKIAELRFERAKLLGYKNHAHFVLEERMAQTPQKVWSFLDELYSYAFSAAEKEIKELENFAQKIDSLPNGLQRWDYAYYFEKLKKEKFDVDDEVLRPYFSLESVVEGVFLVAKKLYGLKFRERSDIPVYHKDVKSFEVLDEQARHVAVFYADFFPRAGKRSGAWMTEFRGQKKENGKNQRPHVAIVCNFTKPTKETPSLLTFNEVLTLFHEFGHSLHGMLADTTYEGLSGTNVFWDFVELPSQILENWCFEKECLDLFAKHYKTQEKIPENLIKRIKESSNFHEGWSTVRQLSFGLLDMSWHDADPTTIAQVETHEKEVLQKVKLLPDIDGVCTSTAFSHIFQGGYSAGYYSYKWAEVLDADAFEFFQEKGIFNPAVAKSFKENILSKGGSEHPMILYKRFRGKEPSPKALLKRAGLL